MIVVTGAAGFIGSNVVAALCQLRPHHQIIAVDRFDREEKKSNLKGLFPTQVDRDSFFAWLDAHHKQVQWVIHLGARTNTMETDIHLLRRLNTNYSQEIWRRCTAHRIPIIYASSAATYGDGSHGFSDSHKVFQLLRPLNAYALSKQEFDLWALAQMDSPPDWYGLKFFNVYGPHEAHKGKMASMIWQAATQIRQTGKVKLFQSRRKGIRDGAQVRDFVSVKDAVSIILWLTNHTGGSGIYNVGTGSPETFNDMAGYTFEILGKPISIDYIPIPEAFKEKYQDYTKADISKLRSLGYNKSFHTLKEGINHYLKYHLSD